MKIEIGAAKNMVGRTFGRFTILARVENKNSRAARWLCVCECGAEKVVIGANLRNGTTKSCGCKKNEFAATLKGGRGHITSHPYYGIWEGMKGRCMNPNSPAYQWYGGKGVSVHPRWIHSFENFRNDMGDRPTDRQGRAYELDRIDSDGDYSPENCQWLPKFENAVKAVDLRSQRKEKSMLNRALWTLGVEVSKLAR